MGTRPPWPTRDLEAMRRAAVGPVDSDALADIGSVRVDQGLPRNERILEYIRQIRNPYCYKCGKFTVWSKYADNGPSLEDCLRRVLI